jgi:hypothetical protein
VRIPTARCIGLGTALTVSVGVLACGDAGDKLEVEDTVRGMYRAFAEGDARTACGLMTAKRRREVVAEGGDRGATTCPRALSRALRSSDRRIAEAKNVRVTKVSIHGDGAEAVVSLEGWKARLTLAKRDGKWRVDGFRSG